MVGGGDGGGRHPQEEEEEAGGGAGVKRIGQLGKGFWRSCRQSTLARNCRQTNAATAHACAPTPTSPSPTTPHTNTNEHSRISTDLVEVAHSTVVGEGKRNSRNSFIENGHLSFWPPPVVFWLRKTGLSIVLLCHLPVGFDWVKLPILYYPTTL